MSALTEARTLFAVGWNRSKVTFRPWPWRSTKGSVNVSVRPSAGMPQIFMVLSSDAEAMTCSWNGLKSRSNTADLCPATSGVPALYSPTSLCFTTAKGPPPPCSATAKNVVLALMYCCSPVTVANLKPL